MAGKVADTELLIYLRRLLAGGKRITFHRFMDLALHHPQYGYYAKPEPVVGPDGDFMTSPALHPAFGQMLWRQIDQMLALLGCSDCRVLEVGAGAGQMARDILNCARHSNSKREFHYLIREQSPRLRQQQQQTITAAWPEAPVSWVDDLASLTGVHVIVMNELMSALPVHRLVYQGSGQWREVYVTLQGGQLAPTLGPVSEPLTVETVLASGVDLQDGQIIDVNVAAADMLADLARCLAGQAFILNIDYGGPAALVYDSRRRFGNVRCYYRQQPVNDLFARPGRQDITADVDFDLLRRTGDRLGLASTDPIPQGKFLLNLGIEEIAQELAGRIVRGDAAADQELQKVYALYAPEALGNSFWVMVHTKGFAGIPPLRGFQTETPVPRTLAELIFGVSR